MALLALGSGERNMSAALDSSLAAADSDGTGYASAIGGYSCMALVALQTGIQPAVTRSCVTQAVDTTDHGSIC